MSFRIYPFGLVAFCAGFALAPGCAGRKGPPLRLLAAIDVSCPEPALLGRYGAALYQLQRNLPPGSQLTLYRFGCGADLIYDGRPLTSRHQFNVQVGRYLTVLRRGLTSPGTQTDLLLEELARQASPCLTPVVILVATDGGMEDRSPAAANRLKKAISNLASNPHVRQAVIFGVQPEFRSDWARRLESLGNRARVFGDEDLPSNLGAALGVEAR